VQEQPDSDHADEHREYPGQEGECPKAAPCVERVRHRQLNLPAQGAFPELWTRQPASEVRWANCPVVRDLEWPDCVNVRDLGGLPVADGRETAFGALIRADNVRRLTAEGWAKARAYGVRMVLDLRSHVEREDDLPVPPGLEVRTVSLFDDFDSNPAYRADLGVRLAGADAAEQYRTLYAEALTRNGQEFAEAVAAIANTRDGGIVFHCVGGKDRTGVLSALLLRLVGVPISLVVADYELSEQRLGISDSAPAGVIGPTIEILEARYGSTAGYLRSVGVPDRDISRVRARLLGP
jgi:protein-tyrosine phosphatase